MNTLSTAPLVLPEVLEEHRKELSKALTRPILAGWSEGTAFAAAEQPAAIAKPLIKALHPMLGKAEIAYVFREKIATRGEIRLAQASRASAKLRFFTGIDLLVEFSFTEWRQLTREQRIALVDHELRHFVCVEDDETEERSYALVGHDVEEFGDIVRRWGLWDVALAKFAEPIVTAARKAGTPATRAPEA